MEGPLGLKSPWLRTQALGIAPWSYPSSKTSIHWRFVQWLIMFKNDVRF
jgi:hypothetical protein